MSKELIAQLRTWEDVPAGDDATFRFLGRLTDAAADIIEALEDKVASLEREIDAYESWKDIIKQRDAIQADNVELVAALESARSMIGHPDNIAIIDTALAKVRKP